MKIMGFNLPILSSISISLLRMGPAWPDYDETRKIPRSGSDRSQVKISSRSLYGFQSKTTSQCRLQIFLGPDNPM